MLLRLSFAFLLTMIALVPLQAGAAVNIPGDSFEIAPEVYWYQYREPSFAKLEGLAFGLNGTYTYKWSQFFFKANAIASYSDLNYASNGTGSANGINAYMADFRPLFGGDIKLSKTTTLSPFTGLGYRVLFDGNGEQITTAGAIGYDRRSQYLYLPLGVSLTTKLWGWQIVPTGEFDYLIHGWQTSYLSDVGFDNNLGNDQNSGYGLRASVMFEPNLNFHHFAFGPFLRYWYVHASDPSTLYLGGVAVGSGYEPTNTTLETGIRGSFKF
jgi:hypothetical protein